MKNLKIFPVFAIMVIASLSIVACNPNEAPVPTSAPTVEQPEVQPTENPLNSAALGSCNNPFNPVMEGKVWKYSMVSGDTTRTYETSYKDITASSFTYVQKFSDFSTEVQWVCGPDGLLSGQFANISIAQFPDFKFETLEVNGISVPTEDKWQLGYSWNTEYVIKFTFSSGETAFEGQGNISVENTISAIEPVTVPSGTYNEAYKVDTSGSMLLNIGGTESTMPLPYTISNWFVKNVGMVKSASVDPTLIFSIELVSLE